MTAPSPLTLGDVAREVSTRAPNEDITVFSVTKHDGFVPSLDYFSKQVFSRDLNSYKLVQRDQFAYATIHLDEGSIGLLRSAERGLISPMYTVFEADPKRVVPQYLLRMLKSPRMLREYARLGKGTVHRRKSISFERFASLPLFLPTLAEQRRIAGVLDKGDEIQRKREEALALTDDLLRSTFLDMFGDPVSNPKGWELASVGALCLSRQYGTAFKANSDSRGTPVLRMNNVTYDGRVDLQDLKWVELDESERAKLDLREGDVLFNRVNSLELVGKTAVWPGDGGYTFAGYLIRLRVDPARALGEYVSAAMNMPSIKIKLENMAKPSINMANISGSDLDRLTIPVPPHPVQQAYRDMRRRLLTLRGQFQMALAEGEALANALSSVVFSHSAA